MQRELVEHLSDVPHIDRVTARVKSLDSFMEKATERTHDPPYEHPLAEIEDQLAGRIIVFFLSDVDQVRESVEGMLNPVEAEHRHPVSLYNEFDYESFHGIYLVPPHYKTDAWGDHEDMPNTLTFRSARSISMRMPNRSMTSAIRRLVKFLTRSVASWPGLRLVAGGPIEP